MIMSTRRLIKKNVREQVIMLELFKELYVFMKTRKKYWLLPIIIVLLTLGAILMLSSGSAVAPFIYTLF